MRRLVLALLLAASVLPAFAATEIVDGIEWTYTVRNGKASVGGVPKTTTGGIAIPSFLGGYPVTSIDGSAFYNCSELTSVTIPDGVTSIGARVFEGCSELTSIAIPDGVTSIGGGAFNGCSKLASISIPDSVRSIGARAFYNCSGLTSITIPDGVTAIGEDTFSGCSLLTLITIPNSVTSIGSSAFSGCSKLTSITIPDGVTSIGGSAFYRCTGLTSITIPDGVTSIKDAMFSWCRGLTNVVIGSNVTNIGSSAFSACSGLMSIAIPDSVTSIGDWAFDDCSGLTSIIIPDGVTSIGNCVFSDCSGLTSISIPDSVTSIGSCAFEDCSGLTSITIPDGVTSIGFRAFSGCSGLTSITIPRSVNNVEERAFSECNNMQVANIPTSLSDINWRLPSGCNLNYYDYLLEVNGGTDGFLLGNGTHYYRSGTNISCIAVNTGGLESGTRLGVGWIGTGSVPAYGTGTNVTFTIEKDSTLTWIWRQENRIAVSVSGIGSCDFGAQWIEDGTTATATIIPSTHFFSIALSGDTNGVTLAGTILTIPSDQPRDISVTVNEVKLSLDVSTAHGMPTPAGTTEWSWGDSVSAFVEADAPVNGVRYACTGWTGTGSVPANGTDMNVMFTIEENSTLSWNWRKENRIAVSVSGVGSCEFGTRWVEDGTTATATIIPTTHLYAITLSGDTNGVTLAGTTLTIPSDGPRDIAVTIEETKLSLDVFSEHGTGAPEPGRSVWSWGDIVTAAMSSDEVVGGWQYACTGWVGTCSVPSSGTGTNLSFAIEEDSTLRWMWQTNVWIECAVSGDATAEPVAEWFPADASTKVVPFEIGSTMFDWELDGDTDGVEVDASSKTIVVPSDKPRNVSVRVLSAETAVKTDGKPVVWRPGEDEPWIPVVGESGASDGTCIRSGAVGPSGTSSVSTMVSGAGTLSFRWKISAGRGDFCRLYVDEAEAKSLNRAPNWTTATVEIGSGSHVLKWVYERGTGTASGSDAAFLDDVDWRPFVALDVLSAFGTSEPSTGSHSLAYGNRVDASVVAPADADGVRRTCTGWSGTGSVPASGTASAVSFVVTNDSSLAWNWRTDYRIAVSVSGPATADFSEGWFESDATKVVNWTPTVPYFDVAVSDDTEDVWLDRNSRTLSIYANCARNVTLEVTERVIAFSAVGPVTTDFAEVWGEDADELTVHWAPTVPYFTVSLSGDTGGVALDEDARTLTIPTTRSRTFSLVVEELTLARALDTIGLAWTTDGAAEWFPQLAVHSDGEDAAQSGALANGDDWSGLETTLDGPGTFSWKWMIGSTERSGVDLIVDGEWLREYAPGVDWSEEELVVSGEGEHVVRFEFWNASGNADVRAWIDQVLWIGRGPVGGLVRLVSVDQTNAVLATVAYAGEGLVPVGRTLETASDGAFSNVVRSVALGAVTTTETGNASTGLLEADTDYWTRLRLSRAGCDDVFSEPVSFRTPEHTPPEVPSIEILDAGKREATIGVEVASSGSAGGSVTVEVSLFESGGTSPIASRIKNAEMPGTVSVSFGSLLPGTAYRVWATVRSDASGKESGVGRSFLTETDVPPSGAIAGIETKALSAEATIRFYSLGDRFQTGGTAVVEVSEDQSFEQKTSFAAERVWDGPGTGTAGISRLARSREYFARAVFTSQPDGLVSTSAVVRFKTDWGETPRIEAGDGEYGTVPGVAIKTFLENGEPVEYFVIRIANPVIRCYYTVYTNGTPAGPFAACRSERVSGWDVFGSEPSYMIRIPVDADAQFCRVGATKFAVDPGTLETDVPEPFYSVRFHANGGTGEMEDQTMELEVAAELSRNRFSCPGLEFGGWAVEENGLPFYADREVVDLGAWKPGQTVDLWAVWRSPDPFAAALDCTNLTFTTGGGADWFVQTDEAHMGGSALRSGAISHNQNTWVETVINGPGTFSFWWKVSSESVSYDYVEVVIDGERRAAIGGEGGTWTKQTYSFSGSGTHTIRWNYCKDGSDSFGSDCAWLDMVTWTEIPEPEWITRTYYWFTPADVTENLLCQWGVYYTGDNAHLAEDGYSMDDPDTMTDGMIDSALDLSDKQYRFAVTSGQTLSWSFPSPTTVTEVRVYNIWGDYGRDRIDIASVDALVDGDWIPLAPGSIRFNDPEANLNNPGRPVAILSMTDGASFVTDATALRIVWGTAEASFVGVGEVEVIGSF